MAFKELTGEGKTFIKGVISKIGKNNSTIMIKGKNSWSLPFSLYYKQDVTFTCTIYDKYNDIFITNNSEYAEYLIKSFNTNAQLYEMDANVIAAQSYQESRYKAWNYAKYDSSAAGITQILTGTMYDIIYNRRILTGVDKATILKDMEEPDLKTSWAGIPKNPSSPADKERQVRNRTQLHQNMCNNPDIMIKAQCGFMDYIAGRNNNLVSNSLFAYNRGSGYRAETYPQIVSLVRGKKGDDYIVEGVNYVNFIFGYLGDKDNTKVAQGSTTKGLWFGYRFEWEYEEFKGNLG